MNGIRRIRNRCCSGKGWNLFRTRMRRKPAEDIWF